VRTIVFFDSKKDIKTASTDENTMNPIFTLSGACGTRRLAT